MEGKSKKSKKMTQEEKDEQILEFVNDLKKKVGSLSQEDLAKELLKNIPSSTDNDTLKVTIKINPKLTIPS